MFSESKKRSKILEFLGRKIYILSVQFPKKQNNTTWTARLTNTPRNISLQYIHTYLTHVHTCAHTYACTHSGVISPYSNFTNTRKTRSTSSQQFSPCLLHRHLIFKPRNRFVSSKHPRRNVRGGERSRLYPRAEIRALILSRIYGTGNSLSWSASAHTIHTRAHTYKLAYILGWSPQHATINVAERSLR